jgi:hypothetical protein
VGMPGDQIFPVLKTIVVRDDAKDASAGLIMSAKEGPET